MAVRPPVLIRPPIEADFKAWLPLWDSYNIEGVYGAARKAKVQRVYWHTQEGNAAARRLYDQVARDSGFVVYVADLDASS